MRAFYASFILLFALCWPLAQVNAQCQYTVQMEDSYGDGWNGAEITVSVNGVDQTFTILSGLTNTGYFTASNGDAISVSYSPGTYEYEVSFQILSPDFIPLYTSTVPPTQGNILNVTGFCPTCPAVLPTSVNIVAVTDDAAVLNWASGGVAGSYTIEWGPTGFEQGYGLTATTSNTNYNISNLNDGVTYDVYIIRDCGAGDLSVASGPYTFTTTSTLALIPCNYSAILATDNQFGWGGASAEFDNGQSAFTTFLYNFSSFTQATPVTLYQNQPSTFTYNTGFNEDLQDNWLYLVANGDTTFVIPVNAQDNQQFQVIGCPTCAGSTNESVDPQSYNAFVNWTNNGGEGEYVFEYGPLGFELGSGTQITSEYFKTKQEIEGLSPMTYYDVYMWMDCGTDSSRRVGPLTFRTLPTTDVGITGLSAPVSSCNLGSSTSVIVRIKNFGGAPQSLIKFRYSVNGVLQPTAPPQDGLFTGVISNDSIGEFSFDFPYDFSTIGTYTIAAWTELEGDANINNDTLYTVVYSIPTENAPAHQDFEAWEGGWVSYPSENGVSAWEYGTPNKPVLNDTYSGENCWTTKNEGNYAISNTYKLESPCFDLSATTTVPTVHLAIKFETPYGYDGAYLQGTTDGGVTWTTVGEAFSTEGTNWYTTTSYYDGNIPIWTGSSNGDWLIASHPLPDYVGAANARFRMMFYSNEFSWNQANGFSLDDIWITVPAAKDLAVIGVSRDNATDCGATNDNVVAIIKNFGTSPQTGFTVGYQTEDGTVVSENVGTLAIAAGATVNYTFTSSLNTLYKEIPVKAWTALAGDLAAVNDTFNGIVKSVLPQPLSFKEDFEASTFNIPAGWLVTTGYMFTSNFYALPNYGILADLYSFNNAAVLESPSFGPINAGNQLTFDYRYTTYNSFGTDPYILEGTDELIVEVSTDCGESWTAVWTLNEANQPVFNTPAEYINVSVDLNDYAGQPIKIRFVENWGSTSNTEYILALDNINVQGCPANFALEGDITSEINDNLNGSITVTGTTGNESITYAWSNGATGNTVTGLANGTYTVTATDGLGCVDQTSFVVNQITSSTEDALGLVRKAILAPNPTANFTNLILELNQMSDVRVSVFTVVGSELQAIQLENTLSTTVPINMESVPAGVYFVRVQAGNATKTLRLMKE